MFDCKLKKTGMPSLKKKHPSFNFSMAEKKVVILGEYHGTQESPADLFKIAQTLASTHKSVLIGLEIEDWVQSDVDQFMASGDPEILRKSVFFPSPKTAKMDAKVLRWRSF